MHLECEDQDDDTLIKSMRESAVANLIFPDDSPGYIGVVYDQKEAGECSARAHLRVPPLREAGHHLRRMIGLRLRATSPDGGQTMEIHPRDLFLIPDGGKDGNRGALLQSFANVKKDVRQLNIMFQQESLEARLHKVRGFVSLNQLENATWCRPPRCSSSSRNAPITWATTAGTCWAR